MPRFTVGDIACLREWWRYDDEEKRVLLELNPNHDMSKASSHPAIVLQKTFEYALVTTVSAHGAKPEDQWRAPWKKGSAQNRRRADRYRSFEGTERFNHQRPFLRLSKGGWPKPQGSWVNVENVLLVPLWALGYFYKAQGFDWARNKYIPRIDQTSFNDLFKHIIEANRQWSALLHQFNELGGVKEPPSPPPRAAMPAPPPPRAGNPAPPRPGASESGWTEVVKKKRK